VPCDTIDYDLILGIQFFKDKRVLLDLAKRRLSILNRDQSRVDFYFTLDNVLKSVVYEKYPVYSAVSTRLDNSGVVVPV